MQNSKKFVKLSEITLLPYNGILKQLFSNNEVERGEKLFKALPKKNIKPDVYTYSIMVEGYVLNGHLDKAVDIINTMKDIEPNAYTYTSLIKGYSKSGYPDKAFGLLEMMYEKRLLNTTIPVNTFFSSYGDNLELNPEYILSLLDKVEKSFNLELDIFTYNIILDIFVKRKDFKNSLEIFEIIKKKNIKPDEWTFNTLLNGGIKNSNQEIIEYVLKNMKLLNINPDIVTFAHLMFYYCQKDAPSEAEKLFKLLLNSDLIPNDIVLNIIISGFASIGNYGKVLEYYNYFYQYKYNPDEFTLNSLLVACINTGNYFSLIQHWNEFQKINVEVNYINLSTFLYGLFTFGKIQLAKTYFDDYLKYDLFRMQELIDNYLALLRKYSKEDVKYYEEMILKSGYKVNQTPFILPERNVFNSEQMEFLSKK